MKVTGLILAGYNDKVTGWRLWLGVFVSCQVKVRIPCHFPQESVQVGEVTGVSAPFGFRGLHPTARVWGGMSLVVPSTRMLRIAMLF
jgi:hypothetical protein